MLDNHPTNRASLSTPDMKTRLKETKETVLQRVPTKQTVFKAAQITSDSFLIILPARPILKWVFFSFFFSFLFYNHAILLGKSSGIYWNPVQDPFNRTTMFWFFLPIIIQCNTISVPIKQLYVWGSQRHPPGHKPLETTRTSSLIVIRTDWGIEDACLHQK